jgi:hypothetical protein
MKRNVRIDYRVRDDVDLEELHGQIAAFVKGLQERDERTLYTSYADTEDTRHFVHIGEFEEDELPSLQEAAFFQEFTAILRARTVTPPQVTRTRKVASTR